MYTEIVSRHDKLLANISARTKRAMKKIEEAFEVQSKLVNFVVKEVIGKSKEENWFLPIVYQLCRDLRLCAKAADSAPRKSVDQPGGVGDQASSFQELAASPIMECYRSCVGDIRTDLSVTKRLAILNLTNQLFRIYFRINKLNLLKPLIRAVENCGPLYEHFSIADKVTYKYFLGRKAMFDANLKEAEAALSYAYRTSTGKMERNRRLILMYLIPVKMFLGHMPTKDLLKRHQLDQFIQVAEAVKQGNLMQLDEALEEHEPFFIGCGIFLMLEKLKIITYRNLFKRVSLMQETHQIPLSVFVDALKFMNQPDVDAEEVACILCNLIYEGKLKGYISHQHQKLVISKQTPFPSLST